MLAKHKKVVILLLPALLFLIVCFFLFKGLYKDPHQLESTLIGRTVPKFTLPDLYQPNLLRHESIFKGQKILLNVWATWCPTCYAEHKFLNKLAHSGIYIVGMNYKDERAKAIRWLTDLKDPYKITLFDKDGMVGMDLGVYGAPETFFIDSKGVIHYRQIGDINPQIWREKLAKIYEKME